jgi:hypothetical protein
VRSSGAGQPQNQIQRLARSFAQGGLESTQTIYLHVRPYSFHRYFEGIGEGDGFEPGGFLDPDDRFGGDPSDNTLGRASGCRVDFSAGSRPLHPRRSVLVEGQFECVQFLRHCAQALEGGDAMAEIASFFDRYLKQ